MNAANGQVNGDVPGGGSLGGLGAAGCEPVFVLCMGRSGSTLLRFLLDAHPDLACPPETSLPALCGQLATVWSLIEGAPLAAERDTAPPQVPQAAVAGIRRMLDEMTGSYLARRGKKTFCDKSLGSARTADLLVQIYPGAKFVCLYRHPMDVIRSGLDACPFGLTGYGFDQYIVGSPGNAVLALARYWLDNAALIAGVEEAHPDRCHRVRYEDLVADPEGVMAELYSFIGVGAAPGVAQAAFNGGRERFGPSDHKIWATSAVSEDSVGRGESVPAALIAPQVAASINELVAKLGYVPVDESWGTPGSPADPRLPDSIRSPVPSPGPRSTDEAVPGSEALLKFLRSQVEGTSEQFASRWGLPAAEKFLVVSRVVAGGSEAEAQWVVDVAARTVIAEDGLASGTDDQDAGQAGVADDDVTWSIVGSPQAWDAVVNGHVNLQAALRRNDLRYCPAGEESPQDSHQRVAMLTELLGLVSWDQPDQAAQETAAAVPAAVP